MGDVVLLGVMWKARLVGAGLSTFMSFLQSVWNCRFPFSIANCFSALSFSVSAFPVILLQRTVYAFGIVGRFLLALDLVCFDFLLTGQLFCGFGRLVTHDRLPQLKYRSQRCPPR